MQLLGSIWGLRRDGSAGVALLTATLAVTTFACDEANRDRPDPYYGVIDATVFDAKFLPTTVAASCPIRTPCYPTQIGWFNGAQVSFYNFGAVKTTTFMKDAAGGPIIPVTQAARAYSFSTCSPGPAYDPFRDAFARDAQSPIFSYLPLATTNTKVTVLPLYAVYGVEGMAGNTCNDLKAATSISIPPAPPGTYGAESGTTPDYRLWAVIDPTAAVNPLSPTSTFGAQ